jgi:hypothetical protein
MIIHIDYLLVGLLRLTKLISSGSAENLFASKGTLVSNLKTWWYPPSVPGPTLNARPVSEAYF